MGLVAGMSLYAQKQVDADEMLRLVNEARAVDCMCGDESMKAIGPLVWDAALTRAAQKHANDMMRKDFFSHTGSDKSSVSQRVDRERFKWRAVGENLALGFNDEASAVEGWMGSPGHCKNIMNPEFTRIGVAVSRDGKYWVQVFGTHMED